MDDFFLAMARSRVLFALSVVGAAWMLAGCFETPPPEGGSLGATRDIGIRREKVDEETQAWSRSIKTLKNHCGRLHFSRRDEDIRPPTRGEVRSAHRAIDRLLRIARRYAKSGYDDQHGLREAVASVPHRLEEMHCLEDQVPRIDRFLRRWKLPDPDDVRTEYLEEESYDESYEEDYDPSYR